MPLFSYWEDDLEQRQRKGRSGRGGGIARAIPFMYHRRLLLLAGLTLIAMAPAAAQMVRLTVIEGAEHRRKAESRLDARRSLPNIRGSITDRHGRLLAVDRPAYDVAVDYSVITGAWADDMAFAQAKRLHASQWSELDDVQRSALIERYQPEFQVRLDALWDDIARFGGITRAELDERRADIQRQVDRLASYVNRQRWLEAARRLSDERAISIDQAKEEIDAAAIARPIREQRSAHVLLRDVPDTVAFEFLRRRGEAAAESEWAGVEVVDAGRREYPSESLAVEVDLSTFPRPLASEETRTVIASGVGTHIVGWMRSGVQAEDEQRRKVEFAQRHGIDEDAYHVSEDRGAYRPGDRVGHFGIEAGAEYDLRGMRGLEVHHRHTGTVETTPPDNGRTVALTIDAALQAHVQALFDPALELTVVQPWNEQALMTQDGRLRPGVPRQGQALHGAVAVVEVDTSDVLALVTVPSFTREAWQQNAEAIYKNEVDRPFYNRALALPYASGSIVKPLMLCAAAAEGLYRQGEQIACNGHFVPDKPDILRCWIYKGWGQTHSMQFGHDLDGSDAIMCSCNIFFFELGRRLGPRRLTEWYRRFGVDRRGEGGESIGFGLGIGTEFPGVLSRLDAGGGRRGGGMPTPDEAVQMAIGQGPIAWTPLHAAAAYAALGRGGVYMSPRIRMDVEPEMQDLKIPSWAISEALEGLRRGVSEYAGTTNHITYDDRNPDTPNPQEPIFNVPGVTVWAKSGTADASAILADLDGDGRKEIARDGDHAWCVCLVAPNDANGNPQRPRYAIAVVVEYGGSGGRVAGPVTNQVIHALMEHGYLGEDQ